MTRAAAPVLLLVLATGCSGSATGPTSDPAAAPQGRATSASPGPATAAPPTGTPTGTPTAPPTGTPTGRPRVSPDDVRVGTAVTAVDHLAGRVGPRPGTSPAYRRAARWVERRFHDLGWQVRRQRFRTPAGVSWGVPVPAGTSVNVVAVPAGWAPDRPHLVVGAHLDTVPPSPGAEDNASGVGVLLAVAEATATRRTRLPVVLVAFGSEEPRGPSDDDHHYGSRAYVDALGRAERRSLRGMVSLDRVGVGAAVPVGSVADDDPLRADLLAAARRAGVPVAPEVGQRSSDHWSFVRAGLPGVRLGSTPYAGYHSAGDVPSVVDADQLERTARVVLAWLR